MSVKITPINSADQLENGYQLIEFPPKFTDWNGGKAVAAKPENRRDDVLLERPTMEMGNMTDLDLDPNDGSVRPPTTSVVIKGKDIYERMRDHNRDAWSYYRSDVDMSANVDKAFKIHLIGAVGTQVGLTPLQQQRLFRRFMELDIPRATGRSELNAFLLSAIVANTEAKASGRENVYHPQRNPENNDPDFQRLAEALMDRFPELTEATITSVYNKLAYGNVPTRHPVKWQSVIRRESFVPYHPSYPLDQHDHGGGGR